VQLASSLLGGGTSILFIEDVLLVYIYMALELLSSKSLLQLCIDGNSSTFLKSHALADGIVITMPQCSWLTQLPSSWLLSSESLQVWFVESSTFSLAIPQVPSSSLAQSARAYYSSTWLLSLEATE